MTRDFIIDEEIAALLPKLTPEEFTGLRDQMVESEHCDDLTVLEIGGNRRVLGDGHNRLTICEGEGIPFKTITVKVADRPAAMQWVIDHQFGRRNLTDAQRAYYRGKEYLSKKQTRGGSNPQNEGLGNTSEKLGEKHKVSGSTIERDAAFAEGVDALPDKAKQSVLKEEASATKAEVSTAVFCRRCRTKGPVKNCPACKEFREQKAKREEAKSGPKKPREPRKPRAEDFAKLTNACSAISRFVLSRPDKERHKEFLDKLAAFGKELNQWAKSKANNP